MPSEPGSEEVMVFVVLKDSARGDAAVCAKAVQEIVAAGPLCDLDDRRLARYGMISGRLQRDRIPALEALAVVASVSINRTRHGAEQ